MKFTWDGEAETGRSKKYQYKNFDEIQIGAESFPF